jgi:predicted pyridoxine 5'-phosphate oxidase superfamily flavin-nucleotide-binding protein
MTEAMQTLIDAWNGRENWPVMATVDADGKPNIIYVGEIALDSTIGFIVADNYFNKTRMNIESGSSGAILFITKDRKAFQVKGSIEYMTEGPVYEKMLENHDPKHPGLAATLVKVEEVYSGAERLM